MLKRSSVENIITAALETGADFAELYAERTEQGSIGMVNGRVETAQSGLSCGAGVRLFFGTQAIYGYANDMSEKNLIQIARGCAEAMKSSVQHSRKNWRETVRPCINPIRILPKNTAKSQKAEYLRLAAEAAKAYSPSITQTRTGFLEVSKHVLVANSEGVWGEEDRVRTRFTVEAVASSASEKQRGHFGPGGSEGMELFERINVEETAREAARIAVTMLGAKPCPAGKFPVVIDNGFGGVIFHEACGHGLEATAVARNASVFAGRLGQQIASPLVTAIDDGTIPNAWGSSAMDDEGTPTARNVLIENGVLKSYLVDRLNGRKMGAAITGSSRRQDYRFAPTSRMTNTCIAPGKIGRAHV